MAIQQFNGKWYNTDTKLYYDTSWSAMMKGTPSVFQYWQPKSNINPVAQWSTTAGGTFTGTYYTFDANGNPIPSSGSDSSDTSSTMGLTTRDIYQEGLDQLKADTAVAPGYYALQQKYAPLYANLQSQIARNQTSQLLPYYENTVLPATTRMTTASRAADINDVAKLGGQATQAFYAANPQLKALMDQLQREAQAGTTTELGTQLQSQAMTGLQAGTGLTESETRSAQQSARAGYSARGLVMSNPAIAQEVLNAAGLGAARQQTRQQFAQSVNQQQNAQANSDRGFLSQVAGQAAQTFDPYQSVLGRSATSTGLGQTMMGVAGTYTGSQGSTIATPFSSYASALNSGNQQSANSIWNTLYQGSQDVWSTQYNANAAANIANINAQAAVSAGNQGFWGQVIGGGLGAIGSVLGRKH